MSTLTLHHPHPSDEDFGQANKRRKVNTCLQCKSRKVKCDKVRPQCGPCQRRRVAGDECIWADEADPETLQHYLGADHVAQQGYDVGETSSAAAVLGLADPQAQAQAVLDRITREMRLREGAADVISASGGENDLAAVAPASFVQGASAVDAADPIIDPSLSDPFVGSTTENASVKKAPTTLANPIESLQSANSFPFAAKDTPERTKLILGLLPNDHVVNVLLDSLRTFESKSPLGISWRLIRIQLINLRGDISDWRTGQVEQPDVDLSFLALLFELMVSAIDCKPVDEIISEGIALTGDQVPEMIERWHSTCQALLAMCDFEKEPNLNTVCSVFLFYLYELRRGNNSAAIHYLRSSYRSATAICMHQLASAEDDASRWQQDPEEQDTTIRTGAVTALRKAVFEGGEEFAVREEQKLLHSLRRSTSDAPALQTRQLLRSNIPDRTHLVREAARMLWVSLTWHLELVTPSAPLAEPLESFTWTTQLGSIDEAHLSDGESWDLPSGDSLASISTHFFRFLSASTSLSMQHKRHHAGEVVGSHLLHIISEWNAVADQHLTKMRAQVGVGRAMLNLFSTLIHHWTRVRILRPYFAQLEESQALASSQDTLIASCKEALIQVQKITAASDVDLSIFQPVILLVKVDATLLLALHLLIKSESNDFNTSAEWNEVRQLVKTSLLLIWTQLSEASQSRLGGTKGWRKEARRLVEDILSEAFRRKERALKELPRIKNEDGEIPEPKSLDEGDKLESTVEPPAEGERDPFGIYKEELLAEDPIYRQPLFFDIFDDYLRTL